MPQDRGGDRKAGSMTVGRVALGAALSALVMAANTAARAGDDGNDSIIDKVEHAIGLKSPNIMEYGINYSERSPLVVPPTRDLPPPEAAAPPPVADWPKDPDITSREQAKVEEKAHPHLDNVIESSRPLRPDELNTTYGARPPGSGSSSTSSQSDDEYTRTHPGKSIFSDLFKSKSQGEYATFTGEPARTSLTEPPPGYQTPSPDQPYGLSPETHTQAHVPTASEHGELQR
jgi:hypothetical protein